jgi:hypothetical protein
MSDVKNNVTPWSQRGKQAIQAQTVELKEVGGGGDRIACFYNHTMPKSGVLRSDQKVLAEGQEFNGTYVGSFENQGKFGISINHKIKTNEGTISLPGSGQLNKRLGQVEQGSAVFIQYTGKAAIAEGAYAGSLAHTYVVRAEKLKNQE